jgi:ABC-2 type transport system ATP-binding protein
MNVVESSELNKRFGSKNAVDGMNMEIGEGRITGLIGRNGAGKTTLLKLIAGYWKPSSGVLTVFGQVPFNNLQISANMIFVDENMVFPASFTLREILHEMPRFYKNFDLVLAEKLLDYHCIDPKQHHTRLSKGMRSTFNTIIGVSAHCPLTIFDEPTSGMDASARKDFYRTLLKDYITCPRTVILSSHLLGELSGLLEDILLIDSGRKIIHFTSDEAAGYAVALRGKREAVEALASGQNVLHREEFAPGEMFLAVQNDFTQEETSHIKEAGIELLPVTVDDLCIYLTEKDKGGIDSVFSGK